MTQPPILPLYFRSLTPSIDWKELWATLQLSDPAATLARVLRTLGDHSASDQAFRQTFGNQPEARASDLVQLLGRAVDGDAEGLTLVLRALGAALGRMGTQYLELQRFGGYLRDEVAGALEAAYVDQPSRAFAAMRGVDRAIDHALGVVGDEYLSSREQQVRAERQSVEHALQSSEIRFNRLFEAGIIGILICDLAGNIKDANDCFLNMVHYSRTEVLTGMVRWADMTPPEWSHTDEQAIEQLKARGATGTWEKEYIRKDGSRVPILVGVAMLNDSDCIAFVLDITERRRLEELRTRSAELETQHQRAQEGSRLKNEFLANMSHELRTPLNSIIGFADVLYDGEVPTSSPKHHELLGDILKSGRHLLQLINDVLDLAKVEAGKLDFRPEPVDLTQLIGEVASVLGSTAAAKQLRLETVIDPAVNEVVIDPARLKQVLYNYVSNALKFTDAGGVVTMRALPEGETMFRLEVEDTGIGIVARDISRLFVEFQQLDAGTAKRHAGTGLGLALTKRIVEAQAGSVGVTSEPGKGSVFFATLPLLARASEEPDDVLQPVAADAVPVLVIEDDARDRRLLQRVLSDAGYGVDTAASGAQAIASCAARAYAAITLDLLLPDITGLDVLHSIRAEGKNQLTPVIVVSVVAEKGVVGGFPVHDFLKKPINSQQLLTSLQRARLNSETGEEIWLIDDDPSALKLMDTVLTQLGYRVKCQPSAERALQALETEAPPAAIILDLMMPGVDGFEFLARFREVPERRGVPIIVWTNKDLTIDDHKRLHGAAQAVLLKGYDHKRSLTQEMRHILQRAMEEASTET
jgi:PAS domain S-box-containing protein